MPRAHPVQPSCLQVGPGRGARAQGESRGTGEITGARCHRRAPDWHPPLPAHRDRGRLGDRAAQILGADAGQCHGLPRTLPQSLRDPLQLHQQVPGGSPPAASPALGSPTSGAALRPGLEAASLSPVSPEVSETSLPGTVRPGCAQALASGSSPPPALNQSIPGTQALNCSPSPNRGL